AWQGVPPPAGVSFDAPLPDASLQATSGRHGGSGPHYLYARLRPDFPSEQKGPAFASHAVFVLDTSASENPRRFALSLKLLRAILENDRDVQRFNVLTFSTGAAWLEEKGWLANTKAVRERVLARLERAAPEGATDLFAVLQAVAKPTWSVASDLNVNAFLLPDGQAS